LGQVGGERVAECVGPVAQQPEPRDVVQVWPEFRWSCLTGRSRYFPPVSQRQV
jgi:hypothetical protein